MKGGIQLANKKLLSKNKDFFTAWNMFVNDGDLREDLLREVIAQSWLRCKAKGINPFTEVIEVALSGEELGEKYEELKHLLQTAKPFMDNLYKIVGNTGLIVRLTDREGYVLEVVGDTTLITTLGNYNMYKGCNVREDVIGTNAVGISLITGEPIQVIGGEHYCKQYHNWTSSACPIRDEREEIIGTLSISGPCVKVHPHTLGMVLSLAEAIENQMKLDQINRRLKIANKHFYAIMESISEGLISIDSKGVIKRINFFARRIFNVKEEDVTEKKLDVILDQHNTRRILNVIKTGKKYEEEEICFTTKKRRKISCIANITPIIDTSTNKVEGVVITFKELKVVHSLVNKIVGAEARFTFDDILGKSRAIRDVIKIAKLSAKTDATVLLLGESGTGKELFAQAIHNESKRVGKPFVFINCGAIPRELVGSELFGYVEGAFTGAKTGGHPGKFELADEGTIFLDEIGDMPLDTQANLLRVLETKEIVRIGGHEVIPTDVRVIAATHKDLKKEVEQGNFRRDLFYRLNVMPIYTPSLRERREDVKVFIDYFMEKFNVKMEQKIKAVSDSFYKGMVNYNWPGNVRELQNVMQLIINTVGDKEILTYEDLPKYIKENSLSKDIGLGEELLTLEEIEKIAISKTIQDTDGNIALTAKILGIGRSTLYRKLEKYDLDYMLRR